MGISSTKRRRLIVLGLGFGMLASGALAAYGMLRLTNSPPAFESSDITGVPWGKGFELTDPQGHKRTLADFHGKVTTLFFGYTGCPDMCPTTMAKLADTMKLLGGGAAGVQGLFVTVDPKRDTPKVLSEYVPAFYPTFLGLYGDEEATARTAKEFKVYYHAQAPDASGLYAVDHSGQVYVFDREGRLRLMIRADALPESIAHDLRILLDEPRA